MFKGDVVDSGELFLSGKLNKSLNRPFYVLSILSAVVGRFYEAVKVNKH